MRLNRNLAGVANRYEARGTKKVIFINMSALDVGLLSVRTFVCSPCLRGFPPVFSHCPKTVLKATTVTLKAVLTSQTM